MKMIIATIFRLKLKILIVWTKFTQKGISARKQKLNNTIRFCISELV